MIGLFDMDNLSFPAYGLILDNFGEPIYYRAMDPLPAVLDFKVQPNGLLSFYNPNPNHRRFEVYDETYQLVATYETGNGYPIDLHDAYVMEDGRALLLAREFRQVDMSQYVDGGNPDAIVIGCVVQEVDAAGNVLLQWRSLDHISPLDSVVDLTSDRVNYIHCNSVELDLDGNILISSRHLNEVTKISRDTGDIIWRLGGKRSDFTFVDDPHNGFYYQHDARRLTNGNITVYDNRTGVDPSFFSRGVEYSLDMVKMHATMTWQFINSPITYAGAMGNMQRLSNGNSLIGWGWSSSPMLTEVTPAGEKVFEIGVAGIGGTYRAFRLPWHGYPTWGPALEVAPGGPLKIILYFSWNGATEIASYQIYAGTTPEPTSLVAEINRDGFETSYIFEAPESGVYHFRVMPIDNEGQETRFSASKSTVASDTPIMLPLVTENSVQGASDIAASHMYNAGTGNASWGLIE